MKRRRGRHSLPRRNRGRSHLGHILEGLTFGVGAIFVAEVELDIMSGMWNHRISEAVLLGLVILFSWGRSWAKEAV